MSLHQPNVARIVASLISIHLLQKIGLGEYRIPARLATGRVRPPIVKGFLLLVEAYRSGVCKFAYLTNDIGENNTETEDCRGNVAFATERVMFTSSRSKLQTTLFKEPKVKSESPSSISSRSPAPRKVLGFFISYIRYCNNGHTSIFILPRMIYFS